jgi:hypothetical protein
LEQGVPYNQCGAKEQTFRPQTIKTAEQDFEGATRNLGPSFCPIHKKKVVEKGLNFFGSFFAHY